MASHSDEIRFDASLLAARDLVQADLHRLLVERRLIAQAPAQVDGMKSRVVRFAELAQLEENAALQEYRARPSGLHRSS